MLSLPFGKFWHLGSDMAGNGRGQMRSYNSNRSQSFIFIGLLVVIAILCFNFWNVSTKNSVLTRELTDVTDKMRQTSMRKISVEKRVDALVQQVREHGEANTKMSNEIKLKEEELAQLKNQLTEKENMLSASRSETEEVKQTLVSLVLQWSLFVSLKLLPILMGRPLDT